MDSPSRSSFLCHCIGRRLFSFLCILIHIGTIEIAAYSGTVDNIGSEIAGSDGIFIIARNLVEQDLKANTFQDNGYVKCGLFGCKGSQKQRTETIRSSLVSDTGDISVTVTDGISVNPNGGSFSVGRSRANRQFTDDQVGIVGAGDVNVKVEEHTQLDAGVIASTETDMFILLLLSEVQTLRCRLG